MHQHMRAARAACHSVLGTHLAQGHLRMAMELAGTGSRAAVPQEEGVPRRRLSTRCARKPLLGREQQVRKLRQAELQRVVVLEEYEPVEGLAVLEQIGG